MADAGADLEDAPIAQPRAPGLDAARVMSAHSGVEPQAGPVERAEPEVAAPVASVGAGEGPTGEPMPAQRSGSGGKGMGLVRTMASWVSWLSRPESRSSMTRARTGWPPLRGRCSRRCRRRGLGGRAEEGAEPRAGVDGSRPRVGEGDIVELGERLGEERREPLESVAALLVGRPIAPP